MVLSAKEKVNRAVIFFFYDKDGVVDDYVPVMLEDVKKNASEILVVCNGRLDERGRKKLEGVTDQILVRENKGFDVWAYKAGIEHYGFERLAAFDEVVFMNFTIMGPLYPFREMFEEMAAKDLDFWGLTLFHETPFDPFGKIEYGYLPLHLQSHFITVRKPMLASKEFREYWDAMPMITCYEEAVCWHEAIFTKKFSDYGYQWGAYVDTLDMQQHSFCPLLMAPLELIKNRRCPIVKRRSFFHDYTDFLENTNGECTVEAMDYIKNHLDYDENLIWDNVLRVQNQADVRKCLHLNYILSSRVEEEPEKKYEGKKIALVIHSYFMDLVPYCLQYAKSMPSCCDVYVTTDSREKVKVVKKAFAELDVAKVEVLLVENRGRDVSALLVGVRQAIRDYDYVCFVHDKKVAQLTLSIKGESFSYKCFENLLKNSVFVHNVLNTFEENERIGLLTPPPPNFGEFYPTLGENDWGVNYGNTVELAKKLGIHVDFNVEKEPIAPLGTMFWFRPKAFKALLDVEWKYEDFPEEPNATDGSLLHAIERLYPFVAQYEGYYPAWLFSDTFAKIEMDNLYFMLRSLNKAVFQKYGPNTQFFLLNNIEKSVVHTTLSKKIKRWLPNEVVEFLWRVKNRWLARAGRS